MIVKSPHNSIIYFLLCSYYEWQVSWPLLDLLPHLGVGFNKFKEYWFSLTPRALQRSTGYLV